jgi:hypothetical protein
MMDAKMGVKNMKKLHLLGLLTAMFISIYSFSFAQQPAILAVSMNPPNPSYGDVVVVSVTMCASIYNNTFFDLAVSSYPTRQIPGTGGQVFLVSGTNTNGVAYVDTPFVNVPNSFGASFQPQPPNGTLANCTDCGGDANSATVNKTYTLHIPPASYFTTCNISKLYLQIGARYSNINSGDWVGITSMTGCSTSGYALSWPIPVPPKSFNISTLANLLHEGKT